MIPSETAWMCAPEYHNFAFKDHDDTYRFIDKNREITINVLIALI